MRWEHVFASIILFVVLLAASGLAADSNAPSITLVDPTNNSTNYIGNITFKYRPIDESPLLNCQLFFKSGENNEVLNSIDHVVVNNSDNSIVRDLPNGTWSWNVTCRDNSSNIGWSVNWNLSVDLDQSAPTIRLMDNLTISGTGQSTFYYTPTDVESGVKSCTLFIDNVVHSTTNTPSNGSQNAFTNVQLSTGSHTWQVNCSNWRGKYGIAGPAAILVEYDETFTVTQNEPLASITDRDGYVTFKYTPISARKMTFCNLYLNNSVNASTSSILNNSENEFRNIGIPDGSWNWSVRCRNTAGTDVNSTHRPLYIDTLTSQTEFLNVVLTSPDESSTVTTRPVKFTYSVTAVNTIASCDLIVNDSVREHSTDVPTNATNTFSADLSNGIWDWSVSCMDINNQTYNPINRQLTLNVPVVEETPDVPASELPAVVEDTNETEPVIPPRELPKRLISSIIVLTILLIAVYLYARADMRDRIYRYFKNLSTNKHYQKEEESNHEKKMRLEKYVRNYLNKGYNEPFIRNHLKRYHWAEHDIDVVFADVKMRRRKK